MNRIIYFFIITLFFSTLIYSQQWFSLPTYWEVRIDSGVYNIETADINRDGHLDIVSGNFNETYVYFGGAALLDSTVDVVYAGRCLAITDFNGDGIKDMITMHFTHYDSTRHDYDGELLFYMGKTMSQYLFYLFNPIPDYSIPLPTLYPTIEYFAYGMGKSGIRTGDLNNDGKMDIIINSLYWPKWQDIGKIYIYMGKDIPSAKPDFNIEPNWPAGKDFAHYYEVGDINGDHYDDLLIGQKVRSPSTSYPYFDSLAMLYLFYGSSNQTYDINNPSVFYKSNTNSALHTADWFLPYFSLDDINCDGYKDLVIWRGHFKPDSVTSVHFGKPGYNGFDTIPDIKIKLPDPLNPNIIVGRGISQNIGDYNSDGYDDFILSGSGSSFWLILGGPHFSNNNPYGCRGFLGSSDFPRKAIPVGDQSIYGRNDFITSVFADEIGLGHILMFIGNNTVHTDIKREVDTINKRENVLQVYPNPFNSQIRINYVLKNRGHVNLKLFNTIGQEIEQLKNEEENAGTHEVNYMNNKLPSGIYFLTLNHQGETVTQKIVLMK